MAFEEVKKEYEEVLHKLGDPGLVSDLERFEALSRQKKSLEKVMEKITALEDIKKQIQESKSILASGDDSELVNLAQNDISQLQEKEKALENEIHKMTVEKKDAGPSAVIIEIRAGTGGNEAALFAEDLYQMYSKYGQYQGWQKKVLDSHSTDLGGLKEIVFELKGEGSFNALKNEGGVHRVQRIPTTEKAGRVHTSTATVAVLAKPTAKEMAIRADELKIETFRSSGPGGQNVNKRETAVRVIHLPSGLVVASQSERNMSQNKENAIAILSAKLLEKKLADEAAKTAGNRKAQIGGAKRSEKIRTYNFPQDRVTDHRIEKSWHDIESIMDGKIDKIVETLQKAENNEK